MKNDIIHSIDIFFSDDGKTLFNVISVSLKNVTLSVLSTYEESDDFQSLLKKLDKRYPCIISFNGKGVLSKRIDFFSDPSDLMNKLLPGTKKEDFFIQIREDAKNEKIATLIRNDTITNLLTTVEAEGHHIIQVFLDFGSIDSISDELFLQSSETHHFFYYSITQKNNEIISKKINTQNELRNFVVSGENIGSQFVIPFCNVLDFFYKKNKYVFFPASYTEKSQEYYKKRRFELFLKVTLGFFFGLLLLSFLAFDYFFKKNESINNELSIHKGQQEKFDKINKLLEERKSHFQLNGLHNSSRFSLYVDELGASCPTSIELKTIDICPKVKSDNDSLIFNGQTILIEGYCNESIDINNWMHEIKAKKWVNTVTLNSYLQNPSSGNSDFILEIKYN